MEKIEYKDMFGIYKRVKQICQSYKLFLNRKTEKIELVNTETGEICLTFSFPLLPNVIDKIKMTRRENFTKLFRKIEEENCKIEEKYVQNAIYFAKNNKKVIGE